MVPLDATVSRSAGVVGDVRRSELRVDRRTGAGARSHSGLPPRWPGGRQVHLNAKSGVNAAVKVPALAPGMAAGADQVTYLDLDDTIRATHDYAKQGVGYGYTNVKGLNALLADVQWTALGSAEARL